MADLFAVMHAHAIAAQRHQQQTQRIALHHPVDGALQLTDIADKAQFFLRDFDHMRQQQCLLQTGAQGFRLAPDVFTNIRIKTHPATGRPDVLHRGKGGAAAGLLRQGDRANVQPLIRFEIRQIFRLQEQIGAGGNHESEGTFAKQIEIHHHGRGVISVVLRHVADIHLLFMQHLLQESTEPVFADPADKGAVATQAGDTDRDVGGRAAGAF
ncbi:hypothetical protein D3C79_631500 [compost metagenome]